MTISSAVCAVYTLNEVARQKLKYSFQCEVITLVVIHVKNGFV
jgi:hypothetical protein